MSARLARSPSAFTTTFVAEFSTRIFALAVPQYPLLPGAGPSLTWLLGQRGAGAAAGAGFGGDGLNNRLPAAFRTTEFAEACFNSLRASTPSTVTISPTFKEEAFHPAFSRSRGLPNSTAQLKMVPFASRTFMKKNARGFAQSILVTGPSSVTFRVESYVAVKGSWAGVLVVK